MLYFNASDASNENAQQIFSFFNCHLKWINGQKDFFTNKPVEWAESKIMFAHLNKDQQHLLY